MDKKYVVSIVLILAVILISIIAFQSQSVKRAYKSEVLKGLAQNPVSENTLLTKEDIRSLPEPVQKYLTYVDALGKEKVYNLRTVFEGEMKPDPKQGWAKIHTEQYNFFGKQTRLFHIKGIINRLPADGLDSYIDGKGGMLIKLGGLVTVVNAKGKEMDQGELVTQLNDMCFFAPASLIDKRIQWETIDSSTVKATFTDGECKVSALLYFNDKGELINFATDDRYMMSGNEMKKFRWSTPVRDYKEINGLKLCSYGEAIWHLPEGDYCYGKFYNIKEVEYNLKNLK